MTCIFILFHCEIEKLNHRKSVYLHVLRLLILLFSMLDGLAELGNADMLCGGL